ncbi:MAG: hypothetical protein ACRD72_22170 [Candidatus Angelobacter sp.]
MTELLALPFDEADIVEKKELLVKRIDGREKHAFECYDLPQIWPHTIVAGLHENELDV